MSDAQLAFAEPTVPARRTWLGAVMVACLGIWAGFFGPIQVLLGLQAAAFTPHAKEATLALVSGLGAFVSGVANPLAGALSDRTTARVGRRVPWVAGGAVGGVVSMLLLAYAPNVAVMALGWCLAQATLNGMMAAIVAAVPDQVPKFQRGTASGFIGGAQTLGVVAGTGIAALAGGYRAGYLVLAGFLVATALPYLVRSHDIALPRGMRPAFSLGDFVKGFWIDPRRYPDFGWAWITRFIMNTSNSMGTLYLLYYLTDAVRRPNPTGDVLILTGLYAGMTVLSGATSGIWSDRVGRRKIFVMICGGIMAVAALTLALFPTWTGAIVGASILGIGYGIYMAVDFALITEVLPAAADRARDLGVINIANSLPQVVAPVIAAPIIAMFATKTAGYRALYVVAALVGLLGAVLVTRIRSVR